MSERATEPPGEAAPEALRGLMVGYQRGDPESFERLYTALAPALRRSLRARVDDPARAEDLLQETFLQLHCARHTYDPSHPVEPWTFAIARHVFLMDRRRRARRDEAPLPGGGLEMESPEASAEEVQLLRSELRRALSSLTAKRRGAVLLHHEHGLSFDEIGARLGIRPDAARLHSSRGVRALRELMRAGAR